MRVPGNTDDGIRRTLLLAEVAPRTFIHIDQVGAEFTAYAGPAVTVEDMLFILFPEKAEGAEHRVRSILPEA